MNSMDELHEYIGSGKSEGSILLDVRSVEEFSQGHIEGAINLPHDEITKESIEVLEKGSLVIVFCYMGGRARMAYDTLNSLGVKNLLCISADGMARWIDQGFPVTS